MLFKHCWPPAPCFAKPPEHLNDAAKANSIEARVEAVRNTDWGSLLKDSEMEGGLVAKGKWGNGKGNKWSNSRNTWGNGRYYGCLLYTSPSPRDRQKSRMPSSA